MKLNDAILIQEQAPAKFEDNDLDWLIGEIEYSIDEAKKQGLLLHRFDPGLARTARDFFARYHQRIDFLGAKIDFDSVRIGEEEWNDRFREKIRSICADPTAKRSGPPCSEK